ncbi:MAG: hypothetical protein ABR501_00885, partial [Pyrinomonadaceae bacterium]
AVVVGVEAISPLIVPVFRGKEPRKVRMRDKLAVYAFGDGAAAMVVMSEAALKQSAAKAQVRIVDYEVTGVLPEIMGIGPVPAVRAVLDRQGLTLADIDLIELNEAFAAQVIACDRELRFDSQRLNVNGGAIALGHPIGCTGVRITTALMHEMGRRGSKLGISTLCVSGGMGIALLIESV